MLCWVALWLLSFPACAATAAANCDRVLAVDRSVAARMLRADDLAGLLDMGSLPDLTEDPFFTLSPDGSQIAVSVRRAVPDSNSYCSGIYIISKDGRANLVDSGPGAIFWKFDNLLGKADFPTGFPLVITPRWAPDGTNLAFLKLVDDKVQVWRTALDGSRGRALTHGDQDIEDFRFTADGSAIVVKTLDRGTANLALGREALIGYHFDGRFSPIARNEPFMPGPLPVSYSVIDIVSGQVRSATSAEAGLFSAGGRAQSADRWQAGTKEDNLGVGRVVARRAGKEIACPSPLCGGVIGKPEAAGMNHVLYLRRGGWADSQTALYDWVVGTATPRKLYETDAALIDCIPAGENAICARETSLQPRHLVRIDLRAGRTDTVFDPNPGFAHLDLGAVRRLRWSNDQGVPCFGDLVFPVGYRKGKRYPLIVVQYTSRGFLRGGTGDEFPIQLFANQGYAVLSVQRPRSPIVAAGDVSQAARDRANLEDFRERRSILSAVGTGVKQVIADGIADPERVGITGLSDGSTTVQFAMINSDLFAAASASGCCWESSQAWILGPAGQSYYREIGWPNLTEDRQDFWSPISLARNASRVRVPLLIQAPDDEYLGALESLTALREKGRAVDLYVFPDEHHVKAQPAHRLVVYQRNLDWFDFWLRGLRPISAPDHEEEFNRWSAMCRTLESSHPTLCHRGI